MRRRFVDSSGAIIGDVIGGESAGSAGIKAGTGGGGGQCDLRRGAGANANYVPTSAPPRGGGGVSVTYIPEGAGQGGAEWDGSHIGIGGGGAGSAYHRDAKEAEWAQTTTDQRLQRIEALLSRIASHLGIAGACDAVERAAPTAMGGAGGVLR